MKRALVSNKSSKKHKEIPILVSTVIECQQAGNPGLQTQENGQE